jgi:hypothetical protein
MQESDFLDPRDAELEAELGRLRPVAVGTSRERVWYEAGLAAGRRRVNVWRGAAAGMAVALAGVAVLAARPAGPDGRDGRVVGRGTATVAVEKASGEERAAGAYLRLRDAVAGEGLAGLGPVQSGGGGGGTPPPPRGWPLEF